MLNRQCILVVDDDTDVRDALAHALQTFGFDVEVASDATQAREHIANGTRVSLGLIDCVRAALSLNILPLRASRPS